MTQIALLAATLAALAAAALAIRAYLAVARLQAVIDQVGKAVETDLRATIRAWGNTAQGLQQAVGKLDGSLQSLASTLERVDRVTEKLEPESVARTVVAPAVAKLAAWVAGLRKGLASTRHGKGRAKAGAGPGEGEEG